mmetsp:Transcript_80058/g.235484  ORF Transcript_80058/g.235484 Transcript_80058/m.235484 type:complete len:128 (-) Transcript_80058:63-446(-)
MRCRHSSRERRLKSLNIIGSNRGEKSSLSRSTALCSYNDLCTCRFSKNLRSFHASVSLCKIHHRVTKRIGQTEASDRMKECRLVPRVIERRLHTKAQKLGRRSIRTKDTADTFGVVVGHCLKQLSFD